MENKLLVVSDCKQDNADNEIRYCGRYMYMYMHMYLSLVTPNKADAGLVVSKSH